MAAALSRHARAFSSRRAARDAFWNAPPPPAPPPTRAQSHPGGGGGGDVLPEERASAAPAAARPRQTLTLRRPISLVHGGTLEGVHVTWEQWGDASLPPSRTVLLMPSFSHGAHAASHGEDGSTGWWEPIVGPSRYVDTNHWRVICAAPLGSCLGGTSPLSVDPRTGVRYGGRFPQVTPADMAVVHAAVLDAAVGPGARVHAVIGGSMGGMAALQFAALYPERLSRLAVVATTGRTSPGSVAVRSAQRAAIMADPTYAAGEYVPGSGAARAGLSVARTLGMLVYRTRAEFDERFDWAPKGPVGAREPTFEVESYLRYQGAKFASSGYDPNTYMLLSKAMDLQDIGCGAPGVAPRCDFAAAAARITADALLIGVAEDTLTPARELAALAAAMSVRPRFVELSSKYGHDSFLLEFDTIGPLIKAQIERGLEHSLAAESVHTTGLSLP